MRLRLATLVSTLLVTSPAFADFQCFGTIVDLLIYADGTVNIKTTYRNDYTNICNLQTTRQGVDPFTCALWVGAIESARKMNQSIHVYYQSNGEFSCTTIPIHGSSPAPVYIGH